MTIQMLDDLIPEIKCQYDFIPYANWDNTPDGARPASYAAKQKYPDTDPSWNIASSERVAIRLNTLVLVDYDGNKPEAAGVIPTTAELATALGFTPDELSQQAMVQWNPEMTSLHFLFQVSPEFNLDEFKQSNAKTASHFWKHIDIKTGNQLVYLKNHKTNRLLSPDQYPIAPACVMDELRRTTKVVNVDFDPNIIASDHQVMLAEKWREKACIEMSNTADGVKNATLNDIGCTTAGLIAGGVLDNQASYTLLYEAAIRSGCEISETIATLKSAWTAGVATPRLNAPYLPAPVKLASEVFAAHVVTNTNINVKLDVELSEAISDGTVSALDPNAGILHEQYKYFKDNWVMNSKSQYVCKNTLSTLQSSAFNAKHTHRMPVKTGNKSFKKFVPTEVFENCDPVVIEDLMYNPSTSERLFHYDGKLYLNSYIPYSPEIPEHSEVQRIYTLIYNHLMWLFEDPIHQRYMLDWLAWQVQHTGKMIGWLPLVMGCRGDGKSVLFELVTAGVGQRNTKMMSNKSAKSAFQDWAVGAAVTAFEEIKVDGKESRQVANDMKPFISESRVNVNPKGNKEHIAPNFTNYIAFTNELDPLSLGANDRRWLVLETQHFGKNTVTNRTQTDMKQHFDDIKDAVRHDKHFPAIHWALHSHVISDEFETDFIGRAPDTVFGRELSEQTQTENENRLEEYLNNATFVDGRIGRIIDCVNGFQIQDFYINMPNNWFNHRDNKPSKILIGRWLRNLGYESKVIEIEGHKVKNFIKIVRVY